METFLFPYGVLKHTNNIQTYFIKNYTCDLMNITLFVKKSIKIVTEYVIYEFLTL